MSSGRDYFTRRYFFVKFLHLSVTPTCVRKPHAGRGITEESNDIGYHRLLPDSIDVKQQKVNDACKHALASASPSCWKCGPGFLSSQQRSTPQRLARPLKFCAGGLVRGTFQISRNERSTKTTPSPRSSLVDRAIFVSALSAQSFFSSFERDNSGSTCDIHSFAE